MTGNRPAPRDDRGRREAGQGGSEERRPRRRRGQRPVAGHRAHAGTERHGVRLGRCPTSSSLGSVVARRDADGETRASAATKPAARLHAARGPRSCTKFGVSHRGRHRERLPAAAARRQRWRRAGAPRTGRWICNAAWTPTRPAPGFDEPERRQPRSGAMAVASVGEQRLIAYRKRASQLWGTSLAGSTSLIMVLRARSGARDLQRHRAACSASRGNAWTVERDFTDAAAGRAHWYHQAPSPLVSPVIDVLPGADPMISATSAATFDERRSAAGAGSAARPAGTTASTPARPSWRRSPCCTVVAARRPSHGLGFAKLRRAAATTLQRSRAAPRTAILRGAAPHDDAVRPFWTAMTAARSRVASAIRTGSVVWAGPGTSPSTRRAWLGDQPGAPGRQRRRRSPVVRDTRRTRRSDRRRDIAGFAGRRSCSASTVPASSATDTRRRRLARRSRSASSVSGRIALVDRGTCAAPRSEVANAQAAGAVGGHRRRRRRWAVSPVDGAASDPSTVQPARSAISVRPSARRSSGRRSRARRQASPRHSDPADDGRRCDDAGQRAALRAEPGGAAASSISHFDPHRRGRAC